MVPYLLLRIATAFTIFIKKEGSLKINVAGIPISDVITFFFDNNNRMWVIMRGYNRCYDLQQDSVTGNITLTSQKVVWNTTHR